MTDQTPAVAPEVLLRFAELVALIAERPTAAVEQRTLVKVVADAAKRAGATLTVAEGGGVLADGAAVELPLIAKRLKSYGVEELGITGKAGVADLFDLARMLAAEPVGSDPAGAFAGRAAVLDSRALPLRLRPRAAPVVSPIAAPAPRLSKGPTPSRPSRTVTPVVATPVSPATAAEPEVDSGRLERALPVPEPSHPALAAAVKALAGAGVNAQLFSALDELVHLTEIAFRQGRHADLVEAVAALVAIEYQALEKDSSDERRQIFNGALGRLTRRPMLLRQLAMLRHVLAKDEVASTRLQAILFRYGTYGADALMDEFASAQTAEARAVCIEALRGLRRTQDALLALARGADELGARQAARILGELADPAGEALLVELLRHDEAVVRRTAVAALGRFRTPSAIDELALALDDESAMVRLHAVTALGERREPRVVALLAPLLDREPDTEVLHSAVSAIGAAATPEGVQLLIRTAQGEGTHPQRRSAALRIMACRALVAIRTPTAMAAVQVLRDDRDGDVREASMRLVAQAQQRRSTSSQPVVSAP